MTDPLKINMEPDYRFFFYEENNPIESNAVHRFIFPAAIGAASISALTGVVLADTGKALELYRYILPAFVGGGLGIFFWYVSTYWRKRDDQLKQLLRDRYERLKREVDLLNLLKDRLSRKSAVLNSINQVFQDALTCESEAEVAKRCLDVARSLTGSAFGWIGEVNALGRMDSIATSDTGWSACRISGTGEAAHIRNMEIRGIWGRVIKDGKPLITNHPASHPDSAGLPEGHPPIDAFMGIPLIYQNRTIGMFSLANKTGGYTDADREDMEALSAAFGEAMQAKRMEIELKDKSVRLEDHASRLEAANRRIIEQQRTLVEEERVKILLQMAGAHTDELKLPLTRLLDQVQMMGLHQANPEAAVRYIPDILDAGRQIDSIIERIRRIQHAPAENDETPPAALVSDLGIRILSVEDSDFDFQFITALLKKDQDRIRIDRATSIADAFSMIKESEFDLILLDYRLSDGTGLDFLNRLHLSDIRLPVVVITAQGDEFVASEVFRAGAFDYLPKEKLGRQSLYHAMNSAMEKFRLARESKRAMMKMAEMSVKDELTGLYNRRYCMEALSREISIARRYKRNLSLCIFDLDHFKAINDDFGHLCGDRVLKSFGRMLKENLRESDIPCRFGGEEFIVALPETPPASALLFAERLREALADNLFEYDGGKFTVTVSGGIAAYSIEHDHVTPDDLIYLADQALYEAKRQGRNCIVISQAAYPAVPAA